MTVVEEEVAAGVGPAQHASTRTQGVRYWAAFVALGAMFLVMTKGPVYWFRRERAPWTSDPIDDVWVQTVFVATAALVLGLCLPAARIVARDRVVVGAFAVFIGAVLASSLWSVASSRTFEQGLMMLVGTAAALLGGAYLRRFHLLIALWLAMQVGVGLSLWAWWRDWPGALITYPPNWFTPSELTGIYFTRNSLGPVAVVAAATSLLLVAATGWRRWSTYPIKGALVAFAAVDVYVWRQTGSLTPALAIAASCFVVAVTVLMLPGRAAVVRRVIGGVLLVGGVTSAVLLAVAPAEFTSWFGRSSTLAGRTIIWDIAVDFVADRPAHGFGFMAIWQQPEFDEALLEAAWPPEHLVGEAHSGYVEVLLGVGLIGLTLLFVVALVALARTVGALWSVPSTVSAAWFGAVAYALAINLGETYVGANLLPWILLCVATGGAVAFRARRGSAAEGAQGDVPEAGPSDAGDPGGSTDTAEVDEPSEVGLVDAVDWDVIDEIIGVSFDTDAGRRP